MRRWRLTTAAVALAAVTMHAHANSVSYAEFSVDRRVLHGVLRVPLDDVDLLLRLDRDLDGQVSVAELDAARQVLRGYLAAHVRVTVNGGTVTPTFDRFSDWCDASALHYFESSVSYEATRAIEQLAIHTDLLTELYPAHRTLGRIRLSGRDERFTFQASATYDRRIGSDRAVAIAAVAGAAALLTALWLARRRASTSARAALGRGTAGAAVAILLAASPAQADVVMSAPALNATLKTMEALKRQAAEGVGPPREAALFRLGAEADGLASLMSREVESHGMQERELLDLALGRVKQLGIGIAYDRDKKTFVYDGAAFRAYLTQAPRGPHAAAAEFTLLSYDFYQSSATDTATVTVAAAAKQRFLARHPRFEANAEMRLYLAVDYRDLSRRYAEAHDGSSAAKYRRLARAECARIARLYPGTDQASAARQMLRGLAR